MEKIFTKKDLELAFEAGYDFAQDMINNPDNEEYVTEAVILKQNQIKDENTSFK